MPQKHVNRRDTVWFTPPGTSGSMPITNEGNENKESGKDGTTPMQTIAMTLWTN